MFRFVHRCTQAFAEKVSLRANDSILSLMFALIAVEPKGEFDISYLPFDLQVSQQTQKGGETQQTRNLYETHNLQSYIYFLYQKLLKK